MFRSALKLSSCGVGGASFLSLLIHTNLGRPGNARLVLPPVRSDGTAEFLPPPVQSVYEAWPREPDRPWSSTNGGSSVDHGAIGSSRRSTLSGHPTSGLRCEHDAGARDGVRTWLVVIERDAESPADIGQLRRADSPLRTGELDGAG